MKLNNKGFAISSIMYIILVLAVILIVVTLSILSARKLILDKLKVEVSDNIYEIYSITYREALNTLKEEAITYATSNNVEKESIKISDLESSIDSAILSGYKLNNKYLTMIQNDDNYDVYLGKANTVTKQGEQVNNIIDIYDYKIEGNSKQQLLPDEYQPVEYIQSSGTQYLEIDYYATQDTDSRAKYQLTTKEEATMLFGSRKTGSVDFYGFNWGGVQPRKYYNSYYGATLTSIEIDTGVHTMYKDGGTLYIDNTKINTRGEGTSFTTPQKMIVFGCNTNGTIGLFSSAKLYSLQFYDNDVLSVNLVPCYRKSDNVVGMYDTVNNKFYTNKGTGDFDKGITIPSPNIPLEIESVGNKTDNLFDVDNPTLLDGYITGENIVKAGSTKTIVLPIEPNTDYTVSREILGARFVIGTSENSPDTDITMTNQITGYESESLTIKSGENDKYLYVWFYNSNYDSVPYAELMNKINIVEGDVTKEWEPYGYKIPVKVSNNLESITFNSGYYINENNIETVSASYKHTNEYISVVPNTEYKLIFSGTNATDIYVTIPFYDKDKNFITRLAGLGNFMTLPKTVTFTTPDDCYFIKFSMPNVNYNIELSNTTNIYLNEPLRKGGEYADYIEFKNQNVIRKMKNHIFDGTEEWTKHTTTNDGYGVFRNENLLTPLLKISTSTTFMSHFTLTDIGSTANFTMGLYRPARNSGGISSSRVYISAEQTTVDDFKVWLANNKPSIIYPLSTPDPQTINFGNIPINQGINNIYIDTEIEPSSIEIIVIEKIKQL